MMREALKALDGQLSRRGFLHTIAKGGAASLLLDRFGEKLFGQTDAQSTPYAVFRALGDIAIPIDQDPGWATFEPGITEYAINAFVAQMIFGGDPLSLRGFLGTLNALNDIPQLISYGPRFLSMTRDFQIQYCADITTSQFENDGVQDLLNIATGVAFFAVKGVFFSNYPYHLANPGAEYQNTSPTPIKAGFEIMGFRGVIGRDEENALRQRYMNVEVSPGIDRRNPYI